MKTQAKIWFDLAEEDYQNALLLWENHRYGGAVFFAQQSVEKILKAFIVEHMSKIPRKSHRIETLVEDAGLDLAEIDNLEVIELSKAYTRVRYPDLNKKYFSAKARVEPLIVMTHTIYSWVKNKLTKH